MKKVFMTLGLSIFVSSAFANDTLLEKLSSIKDLGEKVYAVKDIAPKNAQTAFELRNSIDHPIYSKNRSLGYCYEGVWPVSRRVDLEIPFKINRKRSCRKSIPKMVEKGTQVINDIYKPLYGRALLLKNKISGFLNNHRKDLTYCPEIRILLNRLELVTLRSNLMSNPFNSDETHNVLDAISILSTMDLSSFPSDYEEQRRYLTIYKRYLTTIDFYAQNFRYEIYFDTLGQSLDAIEEALVSGCE